MSGFISTTTMIVLGGVLLAGVAALPAPAKLNVHEQMTKDEIRKVFRTEPQAVDTSKPVPKYVVTSLLSPRRQERDFDGQISIRLTAFEKNVQLWLNPLDGILAGYNTPVYHVRIDHTTLPGRLQYDLINDPMPAVGRFLEDKDKQTTLAVTHAANGRRLISGHIGSEDWTIYPLPNRFNNQNDFVRTQNFVDDKDYVGNATTTGSEKLNYHVIYKNPGVPEGGTYSSLPIDVDFYANVSSRTERSTVTVPSIIYPQIIVVADYGTFTRHNKDTSALLAYLISFWNAVDMKYRGINNPSVRLNIAGIIIEAEPDALFYMSDNRVSADMLNSGRALIANGIYRRSIEFIFSLNNADIMVTMTPYDMCNPEKPGCQIGTLGLAYNGGACKNFDNGNTKASSSVAILQDRGGFDGVFTAAHELGHLFGAEHDGDVGVGCSKESGFIMTPHPVISYNVGTWSTCSLVAFDRFFKNQLAVCLFNPPQADFHMPRVLPGRLQTLDEQCMAIRGTKSCYQNFQLSKNTHSQHNDEICLRLKCFDASGQYCSTLSSIPTEGSICGNGMICLNARCLRQNLLI